MVIGAKYIDWPSFRRENDHYRGSSARLRPRLARITQQQGRWTARTGPAAAMPGDWDARQQLGAGGASSTLQRRQSVPWVYSCNFSTVFGVTIVGIGN